MDFNKGNEDLFGARNENSVLFSLDDLNSMDSDSSGGNAGGGFGSSGDASGLINLDTLSRLSSSSAGDGDEDEGFGGLMGGGQSRVFNAVPDKKANRRLGAVIGVAIAVVVALVVGGWLFYSSEKEKADADAAEAKAAIAAAEEAKREQERLIQEQQNAIKAKEDSGNAAQDEIDRLKKELEALKDAELQAKVADGGEKKEASKPKSTGSAGSAAAAAAPAKSASSGGGGGAGKADPAKIKQALVEANNKAKKCGKNGNLVVQMNINSSGAAKAVSGVSGSFKGSATEKCIITVVEKHSFPKFSGNAIPVKYNFKL